MIAIEVNYIWSEYIEILKEYAPIHSFREKNNHLPSGEVKPSLWDRVTVYLLGSVMFAIKVRKVGICKFSIDYHGFSRESNIGIKLIPWEEVISIHSLSNSYLLELEQGFIPLPFRCFKENQRSKFEELSPDKFSR